MSSSRSSLRNRTLAIAILVAAAVLAPLPVALAWPPGTCEPSKDKNCVVNVSIAKTSDRDTYAPGDVATYTITVTNTGNTAVDRARIAVSDPALTDLAPTGATTGWLSPGQTLQWTGTRALTTAECGQLPNTATVSLLPAKNAGPPDSNAGNDTATRTVVVGGEKCTPPVAVVPIAQSPTVVTPPVGTTQVRVCPRPTLAAVVRGPQNPKAGSTTKYHVTVRTTGQDRHQGHAPADAAARVLTPRHQRREAPERPARRGGRHPRARHAAHRPGAAQAGPLRPRREDDEGVCQRELRGAATAVRTVQAVAVAPARVQPAVTG